jgi:molybdopterin synthase sulfur carrier subunit
VIELLEVKTTTVILPYQLKERCGGARSVELAGGTVRELIDGLERQWPGMKFSLCYETGEIREFVKVFVGQEDTRYLDGIDTAVSGETVHIIHSVAGG